MADAGLTSTTGTGWSAGQPKRAAGAQLIEDFLGQRGVTAQVGMLGIVEERVVEDPMPALGLEDSRAVDQQHTPDAGPPPRGTPGEMPRDNARAWHRTRGPGCSAARASSQPPDCSSRQCQPVVRLGELGMALDQLAVVADRLGRVFRFQSAGLRDDLANAFRSLLGCGGVRIDRLGSNPPSFEAGMMKIGSVPIDSQ